MVGLLLKGRRLWQKGSLLSMCCSFHSTHQSMQLADVVQLNNIRAPMASPPGYEGPIAQSPGLLCSCTYRLRIMETLPGDILINEKVIGFFNGGQCSNKNKSMDCFIGRHHGDFSCYPKLFNKTEHSSGFVGSIPQIRTCSRLLPQRRRDPLWIGRRSFFSAETYESLSNPKSRSLESPAFRLAATDATEAESNASSSESDEDFDFRNFPALTSSFYQDYERPIEMAPKKRVAWQTRRKVFNTDSKLTLESIPQPKGCTYDFGLGDMFSKPPPLKAGARPQGGFDIDISLDECEKAPIFPQRMPNHKLPWDTPEADSLSEISADSQDSVSKHGQEADNISEISTDSPDSVSKHEQEFCWDPYDFDESVKLPHKLQIEES